MHISSLLALSTSNTHNSSTTNSRTPISANVSFFTLLTFDRIETKTWTILRDHAYPAQPQSHILIKQLDISYILDELNKTITEQPFPVKMKG